MACGHCWSGSRYRFLNEIRDDATLSVNEVIDKAKATNFDLGDRTGGYFCLLEIGCEEPAIPPTLIGEITNGREEKYLAFCQKKATDLLERQPDDELSWQSRDPEQERWAGAVRGIDSHTHKFIFSFSGLPEMLDEAAMLLTAIRSGCLSLGYASELALVSGNTFFLENQWDVTEQEAETQ